MRSGEIVVLMDGDGQNDPADIPAMLAKLDEGNDLVAGWRFNRQDPFLNRRLPSMIANRLISWTTQVKLHDYGCTLKVMRQDDRERFAPLRRNAPIHSGHRLRARRADRRIEGQSPAAAARRVEVRYHAGRCA